MTLKKLLSSAVFCFATLIASSIQAAPISSDLVFVVDESGSMANVQANLRNNIGLFSSILSGTGQVDPRFGLVGYGNSSVVPRQLTDFADSTSFSTAATNLIASGGQEPGYTATAYALNALDDQTDMFSYRPNAVKNIIILTDEPSNYDLSGYGSLGGEAVTSSMLDGLLTDNNALYNGVLRWSNTITSYESLITSHGGSVFDLNQFNSTDPLVVEEFVTDFATEKLQETLDFCVINPNNSACNSVDVPESGSLALIGLGLAGMYLRRRRRPTAKMFD